MDLCCGFLSRQGWRGNPRQSILGGTGEVGTGGWWCGNLPLSALKPTEGQTLGPIWFWVFVCTF